MAESSKEIAMTQLNTNAANTTTQSAATVAPAKKSMFSSFHLPGRSASPTPTTTPATASEPATTSAPASPSGTVSGEAAVKKSWMPSFSRSSSPAPAAAASAEENTEPKSAVVPQSTKSRLGNTINTGLKKIGLRSSSPAPAAAEGAPAATPSETVEGTATTAPAKKSMFSSFHLPGRSSPKTTATANLPAGHENETAEEHAAHANLPAGHENETAEEHAAHANLPAGHEHETAEEHAAHANLPAGHENETAEEHAAHANLPAGHEHETAEEHAAHANLPAGHEHESAEEHAAHANLPAGHEHETAEEHAAHAHEEPAPASSSWFGFGSTNPTTVTGNVSVANSPLQQEEEMKQEEMQQQEMQQSEGMESRGEGPNFSKMSIPEIMSKIIVVGQLYSIDNKYLFIYKGKTSDARIMSGKNSQYYHDFFYIGPETNVVVPPEEAIHKHNFLSGLDFKTLRNLTIENGKNAAIKIALSPFFGYTLGKPESIARRGIRHFYEIDNEGTCKQLTNIREGTPGGIFIYRPEGMKGPSASNITHGGFYTHFINSLLKGGDKSKKHNKVKKSKTKKRKHM